MIVNKKFDRLRQWGRERMGGEVRTDTNDEFKSLEIEMQLRGEGMERLNRSAKEYIKHISRRDAGEAKEKQLPVGYFGNAMMTHGEDFEPDSEFGQCLSTLGRANERIARIQETYCANATSSWLESIERSLVQMKEFNEARRKLDNRRLAYDTATAKMQKTKKEDFRMEEELRSQKAKYEESSEDVYRRMMDIKDAESETVADLTSFLEAELTYYDRCRELLLQVKRDWPASGATSDRSRTSSPANGYPRRNTINRSRNNSLAQRFDDIAEDEALEPPHRPGIRSRAPSGTNSPRRELPGFDISSRPPINGRANSTFEGPTSLGSIGRSESPASTTTMPRLTRVPTEPTPILTGKASLRSTSKPPPPREPTTTATNSNIFSDDQSSENSDTASFLPHQPDPSRSASWSQNGFLSAAAANGSHDVFSAAKKTPPPPPPPSRAKKPPPPPPMKRSALSTGELPRC
ncbi:BAR-domain-containing protein [Hortaea werneckii]|uniref:BAR domain-containing protein n=1 Tax=Hortaea werneckii TaxID=91943 RepID=A0A3M7F4M8_HORWE|nr:BAR-domain-containing protein [Hortaea werneckii]KAI6989492.1 BAR-domain-containing protein [Hortaea werneckii]KAI7083390.1 BAR-domain-containing protein [Hortaea werneckii]KAI7142184.1 BAR-domain-containing protein [Hortaea werneckii]KAI7169570.1 BAR-domain-containing protein [Hortaea werneckii]